MNMQIKGTTGNHNFKEFLKSQPLWVTLYLKNNKEIKNFDFIQ